MSRVIKNPSIIKAHGTPPKKIEEFIGRINSRDTKISIARMVSPAGWEEPGQRPEFDEYTVVLKGTLHIEMEDEELDLNEGQAFISKAGEWIRYSSPLPGGAEYIAVCLPAFSPETVNRDNQLTVDD